MTAVSSNLGWLLPVSSHNQPGPAGDQDSTTPSIFFSSSCSLHSTVLGDIDPFSLLSLLMLRFASVNMIGTVSCTKLRLILCFSLILT